MQRFRITWRRRILLLAALAMGIAGVAAAQPVRYRTLAQGAYSGVREADQQVIRNQQQLERLWARLRRAGPIPSVNFRREMVLAVFMGRRPTAGYRIEIIRVRREGRDLVATVRRQSPPRRAVVAQVRTTPFHIVAVPRVPGRVQFILVAGRREERRTERPRTLARGFQSGVHERLFLVARTPLELRALWRRHHGGQDAPPPPQVDFNREMVLAAFMGDRPTGGYAIEITQVEYYPEQAQALVRERRPAPGQVVTEALTQPFHIVAVPRTNLPVQFRVPTPGAGDVEPRSLARGDQSAIRQRQLIVIRNPEEWRAFWERHTANLDPQPLRPQVDFDREMVLVALMGEQRTGGHAIRIEKVIYENQQITVHVQERHPQGGGAIPVLTAPYHLVAVPRSNLPIRFQAEQAQR